MLAKNIPIPEDKLEHAINPSHEPAYTGPTGAVAGTVRVRGDEPAMATVSAGSACAPAKEFFGPAFRETKDSAGRRQLADALVAVTEYKGFVPASGDVVPVEIQRGCVFDHRAYSVTFGQRIEVSNRTLAGTFVPDLVGADLPAKMAAMPNGEPVRLYPLRPGYYEIRDSLERPWMKAGVYVLKYSTHTVSDAQGRFRIGGIPVGKVKVSVLSPVIEGAEEHEVEIRAGATTDIDFELSYKKPKPAPPPSEEKPLIH